MKSKANTLAFFGPLLAMLTMLALCSAGWATDKRDIKRYKDSGTNERVALLIGNGEYSGDARLDNPGNDVEDYGAALRRAGFKVSVKKNLAREPLLSAVADFAREIENNNGIALFHYAGHGIAIDAENYLVPLGVDPNQNEALLQSQCIPANSVVKLLGSRDGRVNVVILDMCRSLPLRGSRGGSSGLVPMKPIGGTLLAFSTGFGAAALDGRGQRNSPYARQLIAALAQNDLSILDYFNEVRGRVMRETGNAQIPVEENKLTGRAPLLVAAAQTTGEPARPEPAVEKPGPKIDAEEKLWQAVEESSKISEIETYLKEYPKGRFAALAGLKINRLRGAATAPPAKAEPAEAKAGDTYTDPTTGMEFIFVPGGCFQMGDTFGDDGQADEKPVHEVCVDSFYMGKYEVTQGEYTKISGSNPSLFKKGDRYPVEQVSWDDAQAFIKTLSSKSGKPFRLPTEAEWEYAARSGGKSEKYSGSNSPDGVAWYWANSGKTSHQVGTKSANGLGLFDMSGNVWEWCNDWYGENYYGSSPRQNPARPSGGDSAPATRSINRPTLNNLAGPSVDDLRVSRGGGWSSSPGFVRSADRGRNSPDYRDCDLGFRLLLQASAPSR